MKKYILSIAVTAISMVLMAVPAKRGFHDYQLQDGTIVSLTQAGDEFAHWYESADGTIYRQNANGMFAPVTATRADMDSRRKASPRLQSVQQRRVKQDVGSINLAPRGIVILANYKDVSYKSENTPSDMNDMMNADSYTYGGTYNSARQYFISQSDGQYQPVFDVVGPVTVSKNVAYYGENDSDDNDMYPCDLIVEACKLADSQFNVDFTQYDNDHDGYVDFVYVIYAGKGEADGGAANTIWPHNWSVQSGVYYKSGCSFSKSETMVDGLYIDNYACSGELNGRTGKRNSIGTICHEFGHVLGLPDFYDTQYSTNYKQGYTPNEWDIMDGGGYNGPDEDGTCPPNYSPWEKAFFGWIKPVNLGATAQSLTLKANGTEGYVAYQVNALGTYQSPTTSGQCYYIENRQQQGWDSYVPGHGMLVWAVNYDKSAWDSNEPNNKARNPKYTISSATGSATNIGTGADPFPGTKKKTSWSVISDKPIKNITESNGVITCDFISAGGSVDPGQQGDITQNYDFVNVDAIIGDGVVLLETQTADFNKDQKKGTKLELLLTTKAKNSIIGTYKPQEGDFMLRFNGGTVDVMPSRSLLTITKANNGYNFTYTFTATETGEKKGIFTIADSDIDALFEDDSETFGTGVTGLSVAETKEVIDWLGHNNETDNSYFVAGIISTMRNTAAQIAQYKTARFNISDDGSADDELYSYNTRWLNDTNFSTGNEVVQGDRVIIYGKLQNYQQKNGSYEKEVKGYVYEYHSKDEQEETSAESVEITAKATKQLIDGQLVIRRGAAVYNILGVQK